jgi:hypothetical protein
MKTLLLFLFLVICAQTITAQTKPGIRIPGETPEQKMDKRQGFFKKNTSFEKDKRYFSEDNRYALIFQSDGNLVVYKIAGMKAIWNSHTNGRAVKSCIFQADGNLVLYDYTNKAVWNAATDDVLKQRRKDFFEYIIGASEKILPANWKPYLVMQNDGNLVIYALPYPNTNDPLWSSNSFEKNN